MNKYSTVSESAQTIAAEVVATGKSSSWVADPNQLDKHIELERNLGRFNIGYIDDKTGTWGFRKDGTKFFQSKRLLSGARSGLGKVINLLKK